MKLSNPYSDNADCGALAEFCRKAGRETVYRRHEYFGRRGGPAIFMGYIEEGGVRYAVTDDAGRSHTVGFCFEGDFAADYSAFVQGRPALVDSVAIQDTRMWVIISILSAAVTIRVFWAGRWPNGFSSALTTGCWDSTS